MLKPSPLKHKEDGHALLSEEAHTEAHAEENVPDNFFSQPNPMNLDRPQTNILVPEINPNTPLSSADFYNKDKSDKESKDPLLEVGKEKVDGTINPQTGEKWTREQAVANMKSKGEKGTTFKPEDKIASETELLKAWLNTEYFGKGVAQKAIGNNNLTAYQKNNPGEDALRKDFKSNLGRLETGREAFPSLTDSNLDNIFGEVFDSKVRNEKGVISKASQYTAINDGLEKKVSIAENINNLSQLKIKTNESRAEAEYADAVEQLRALGPLKEGEEKSQGQIVLERSMDINTPGSLADRAFNKDEMKYDPLTRRMTPTGKRIPKDVGYKRFHDPSSGKNINEKEARAVRDNGGATSDITDAYETYLGTYENTSQADLAKYNDQVLLEEAGYNIEGKKTADYYVGDKIMRNMLAKQGYKTDKENPDIFKDVPLSVMTNLSHVPGMSNFWSPNTRYAKGEVIPQSFEGMPYENEEEFHDHLRVRRNQGNNIAAKNAALWETYYLNRDPSTIEKSRLTQFTGAFANSMFGEQITDEQWDQSGQDIVDIISQQIVPDSGVDVSLEQEESFERTFMDKAVEGGGGLAAMLATLTPINKLDKALRISKSIMALSAPRYINSAGKVVKQSQAITKAAKQGKNLDDWAKTAGYTMVKASPLQKGIGLATLGIYEDIKMREVLGGMTDGRMEFERGVGFGFALGPKLLPFGFGRFAKGKKYNLGSKSTQMNTFLQSTFVNGGSFALAVESGDLIGAVVKDLQGKKEFETWAHHHWGDRDENMSRIGLNIITGKALGLKNFDYMDFKTTKGIGEFNRQSIELATKDLGKIAKEAKANKMYDKNGNPDVERFIAENQNHKEVENYRKHLEDFQMASERLNLIDQTKKWTGNAAEVGKTYEDHYKPLVDMFKAKGKKVNIVITDKPVMQDVVLPSGEVVKQEVNALYTRMKDSKDGTATIQINTKKSKGKRTANHEAIHAYVDLMFDGNIKLKENFTKSLKQALISIKTPGGNLHKDIMEANDINKMDKLEEMMAYGAEHMGKAENAKLGSAFPGMKKFWNKFAKSTLGLEADVTTKQDVINLMKTLGNTGNLNKLERLSEIIQTDPTGTAREGQVASAEINKAIDRLDVKKAKVLEEMNDLKTAQGNSTKFQKEVDAKRDLFNEYNADQKSLKNKVELDAVDASKQEGWKNQIDKNYTGTSKTKEEFQKSPEYGKVTQDIMSSTGLENMIRQAATKVGVLDVQKQKFVEDVKDRIVERFLKNYDPGKINPEYGRALTPFEYLTTGQAGGSSIIYRSAGDIMNKFKETVQTSSYDAFEGGADAYSTETGYIKADNTTGSRVEKEGIVVADALGINPSTVKKAAGDTKNLNFESDAKAKEKASYKNLGKNYKETIEKNIVVDHYGVSADIYSKMKKDAAQQLNNPDIEAVQKVIKPAIETHIKLIPKWGQVSVDAITGESISLKTVSGVKSETKATGIATVLLKNKLLFKEIPQTGTKGSKYEWSKDLIEYHKTMDPLFKKKFEQKVLDSWGMGETQFNKAKLSGIYKAVMTQAGKAVYMQSVKQALPNTPELTMKHVLANMINQVSAGQSSSLASKDINPVINLLKKNSINIHDIQRAMLNSPKARRPIEDLILKRDALTRDIDVVMENERYAMENYGKTEVELQADLAGSVGRSKQIAKENNLSEKHSDPNYIAKNPNEIVGTKIVNGKKVDVTLSQWRKDLDVEVIKEMGVSPKDLGALTTKKGQSNHHALEALLVELGFGSKSRKQTLEDGTVVYLNKEGKTSAEAIEAFLGEKFTTAEGKSASKYEKVYRPDWSGLKKKLDKLEKGMEGKSIEDIKDAKIELYRKEASHSGESKDFEATEKANREYFEDYITAVAKVAYKNKNNNGVEYMLQSRAMQTNHAKGISKSLGYKMSSLNAIGSAPGKINTTGAKGEVKEKDNKGISNHWEHALQLLNQTNRFVKLMGKHKGVTPEFKKGLKEILDISDQHLIPKNGQLFNDAKGPTTFTEAYSKMLKKGVDNPLLNVFANKYAKLENNFVVSGPNKGKSLLDVQLESIDLKIAKKALLSIPEANWGLFEYKLSSKIKNGKAIDIQNKMLLPKAFRKLASKDINKTIKTIDKALENGRKINKKRKGGSFWDFDDTLATTKSGVRYKIPNPSGKPAPGKKVIFMAGGAGSGKGGVIKQLGLEKQGYKIVNSDISLEWLKKNHGLPENMNDLTKEQQSELGKLQWEARQIASKKKMKYQGNGDGVVVDGTGGSLKVMEKQVQEFRDKGYDVQMVFTETSLETAVQRNANRSERSLREGIVRRNHESVQANKEGFKKLFGENFAEVKTDNLKQTDAMPPELIKKMDAFTKGYIKARLNAEQFATEGAKLKEQGAEFDFSEFNVVTKGEKGPFFQKALDRAKKFGLKDQFVLTARPPEAAKAIYEFLKSQGLEIPLENITGLGNSTGEAKARFLLEKFAEGYNDIYFADDAMQNVKAVRDVLSQLDIKSKVQQALASRDLNKSINDIMNHSFGIESKKVFSTAEGKVRGKDKKRRKFMMTDSASDLELLMEPMYGKGKKGIENKKWFEENFYKPWERGINSLNTARQTILNDYMGLRKQNKDIVKSLDKPVEGTNFTTDQAARVYIWNKAGFEVPGLTKTSKAKLLEHVANNPKLQAYAESVARLTKIETGLRQPKETWWAETIATEVQETGSTVGREKYIGEWLDVKNEIFTKENMAKMESELGPKWREATENMFERMETGKTRNRDLGRIGNEVMNYLNGSVGAIMNLNTRSATLQLISSVNFINHAENNPLKAGLAFANQPQYWKDFMTIMNSDMLKQRRDGLKINVTEAELAAAVYGKGSKAKKALSWILKQGYIPTKIADSFAISSGGATYYRNRAKMYQKQGLSLKEAEAKAFIDFAGIAEKTQQSSRPDLLSQQQTSFEGRLLLPFANTPMQMNRIMVKEMLDIGKGRYKGSFGQDSFTNKMSKVAYYGAIQSAIFAGLQTGLFALMTNSDDDEIIANKKVKAYNTMADSFLRGMGIPGVVASGVKNAGMAFFKQNEKGFNADYSEIGEALLNMSPTIGSKFSKLDQAGNTYNYNKREILEKGFSLDNTYGIEAAATTIEALTNVPIARVLRKTENIKGALDDRNENWQRAMNGLGWSGWDVQSNVFGIEKAEKKEERNIASKTRAKIKKEEKSKEREKENEAVIEENKKKSKRDGICSAISKGGKRCKSKAVSGGMCTVHEKAEQNIMGVKSQCKKIKSGGKRCGMKTSAKSGYCYYHD
tara:strand:+ start:2947 stop:12726 length:9780 start_codon:yes stop_codon:yes gene_type:complete